MSGVELAIVAMVAMGPTIGLLVVLVVWTRFRG